jgi:uncharacterized protein YacL
MLIISVITEIPLFNLLVRLINFIKVTIQILVKLIFPHHFICYFFYQYNYRRSKKIYTKLNINYYYILL